ncbi:hypothetical protein GN956_G25809 [Arapaima gigas]
MVSLTGKEILAKTVPHSEGTEVLLSCDVELEKDREELISSGRSKGLKVTVFSVTQNTAADGNNNGDDDVGIQQIHSPRVAMRSVAAGLPVLTATGLLIVLWQKFVPGSKEENNERTQQPLADNRDAAVPHFQPDNHTLEQDTGTEVWYTSTTPCKPQMVRVSSEVSYAAAGPQVVEPEDQL